MSINKNYVMAGMLATALVAPMTDVTESHADDTRTITGRVNFRTGPSKDYASMGKIEKGETVTYLETSGSWIKIKYNSKTGYVHKNYISSSSSNSSTSIKYVNASVGLNVRKGPSTSYAVITTLADGTKVTVVSTSGDWSKITCGNTTGYVSSKYLSNSVSSSDNNSSTETSVTKYVNASVGLNVRKGPSTSYSVITTLANGTKVTVVSTSGDWSKITCGNTTGYVSSKYLSNSASSSDNTSSTETSVTKYVNSSSGLNVRKGPSTSYSVITTLANGTQVTVKSTSDGWSKITSGSVTGYVSSQYLSSSASDNSTSTSTSVSKVISYAKKLLGKPYVWGAEGPSSFDCSGFTCYVFKNAANINLPRVSKDQSNYGTYVKKSDLREGDLIFFDTSGENDGNVSHVGIYLGNNQFIHCSSSKGQVVISEMSSYYTKAYVNARRVL